MSVFCVLCSFSQESLDNALNSMLSSADNAPRVTFSACFPRAFWSIGGNQFEYPVWNTMPILALDAFEHAFRIAFGPAKGQHIEKFLANLD